MGPERTEDGNGSELDAGMSLRAKALLVDPFVSQEHDVGSHEC